MSLLLIPLIASTIVLVHGKNGWLFTNEDGGREYPAFWNVGLLVLAAWGLARPRLALGSDWVDVPDSDGDVAERASLPRIGRRRRRALQTKCLSVQQAERRIGRCDSAVERLLSATGAYGRSWAVTGLLNRYWSMSRASPAGRILGVE